MVYKLYRFYHIKWQRSIKISIYEHISDFFKYKILAKYLHKVKFIIEIFIDFNFLLIIELLDIIFSENNRDYSPIKNMNKVDNEK